ncbi:MAG: hypothetical protein ACRECW_18835 [Phyllobacterium sp.]
MSNESRTASVNRQLRGRTIYSRILVGAIAPISVQDQTIRQVVRISLDGTRVRLVFSNAYGDRPLRIGSASVGGEPDTIRKLTFGRKDGIVVPPGAPAISDPAHPARLNPAFDSGDHLHPGDEGNQAMADAIDLDALLGH